MATPSTRFFSLFTTSNLFFTHNHTTAASLYTSPVIRSPTTITITTTLFTSTTRGRPRHASSSASFVDDDTVNTASAVLEATDESRLHPWPEWVNFVDRLKTKGYLIRGDQNDPGSEVGVYRDMSVLKEACLSFARDRFDIFRSLSRQDIQTLVEKGCPNINRKTVNSGKRLRAHLQIDEGDACGNCILRGSCDRAYVILKDFEADARTVDIVRILLNYALDPVVSSNKKPSDAELVEASARKLLLELTELSGTTIDPQLQKPAATVPRKERSFEFKEGDPSRNVEMKRGDWFCPKCNFLNFSKNKKCRECNEDGPLKASGEDVEMKKGDWICPQCNFMNFSKNKTCRQCKEDRPLKASVEDVEMKKGDWICPECNFMNFWRNIRCLKCKTKGPRIVGGDDSEMKKGDWNCPGCRYMNYASNTKCLRCREPRPKRQLNPGEWECPSCDFFNFSGNVVCRKCNHERPKSVEAKYEDQMWRKQS